MGINIGICEMESKNAKCAEMKKNIIKVMLSDVSGFESAAEIDEYVTLSDAKSLFSDYDDFMKRNRINVDSDAIYIEKVKKEEDLAKLKPKIQKKYTGWVDLSKLSGSKKTEAIEKSKKEDRLNGWDVLDFDQMNETCASCPLSWDKGRGCIGAFGPNNSDLPKIAKKYNCEIIASAPESATSQKKYTPADAAKLKKEIEILTAALPDEGKVYVRRYSGPLERMNAVAEISVKEKIGFFFF